MALPPDFRQSILSKVREKAVNANCELCRANNWSVLDQPVSVAVTDLSGGYSLPPPQVPAAALICNNCGNIRLFALAALGLLPSTEELVEQENR